MFRSISAISVSFALCLSACGTDKEMTSTVTNTTPPATVSDSDQTNSASESADTSGTGTPTSTDPGTTTDPTATTGIVDPSTSGSTVEPGTTTEPLTTTEPPATEGSSTTVAPETTTESGTSTGGMVEPDPKWPPPTDDPNMPCPDGFAPAAFVDGGIVCAPKCSGPGKVCPTPATGTAKGQCVFNPESTGMDCEMSMKCDDAAEMCQMTGGGGMACLKPSDHCVLLCNGGESCPDGMECFGNLVCQYPL